MHWMKHRDDEESEEIRLLREQLRLSQQELAVLKQIAGELKPEHKLSFIKLAIGGTMPVGPATLTVGDQKTATVLGFDQNGAAFAIDFTTNPVTWTNDNETAVTSAPTPASDGLTAVAVGVDNLTATCAGFTDTESITVVAAAPKLASIKVSID